METASRTCATGALTPYSSFVQLERPVQTAPVMLAKVSEAEDIPDELVDGPSLSKAYAMEVMQTIKEILKLNPFFKEQMQVGVVPR